MGNPLSRHAINAFCIPARQSDRINVTAIPSIISLTDTLPKLIGFSDSYHSNESAAYILHLTCRSIIICKESMI